ncbi:MAG: apolipoprotein N-acyltransferase, partial [Blastocatellia bacterium]
CTLSFRSDILTRMSPTTPIRNPKSAIRNLLLRVRHSEEAAPPAYAREDLLAKRFRPTKVLPYQQSAPFISNLSLAIFSGVLLVFAFPEWNLWSLGWVGTAPLIMAVVRERRFWRSLLLGSMTGTVFYAGSSQWVMHSMHNYGGIPMWLCFIILTIFSATLGVFTGLFAAVLAATVKRFGGWAMLFAPIIWAASEWARLEASGVGWNALGYSQAFQPAVVQTARWGGVYLVSAVMVAASTALVFAVVYLEQRRGIVVLTVAGAVATAVVLYGESLRPASDEPGSIYVAAIQPNIPIDGPWGDPRFVEQMYLRLISLSGRALQDYKSESRSANNKNSEAGAPASAGDSNGEGVGLVIWPESPMGFEYDRDKALQQQLGEFTRRNKVHLLINSWGYPDGSSGDQPSEAQYNSAVLISPAGEKADQYDKVALVPFGEFVPARGWIPFMDRIPALVADIVPGNQPKLIDAAGARLGTSICFEVTRPDLARRMRLEGATALVQISNELWFGASSEPRQMLAEAVFRAVENGVDLVRVTNSGLSARINSYGIVSGETPLLESATRVWKIKSIEDARSGEITFYTRRGDVFAIACAIVTLLLLAASLVPMKWRKESDHRAEY